MRITLCFASGGFVIGQYTESICDGPVGKPQVQGGGNVAIRFGPDPPRPDDTYAHSFQRRFQRH